MFDEEGDTITVSKCAGSVDRRSDAFELLQTAPIEVGFDTTPVDVIEFDDTSIVVLDRPTLEDRRTTDKQNVARAATDADWPPTPQPPAHRLHRRAGIYRAITGGSKLTKI